VTRLRDLLPERIRFELFGEESFEPLELVTFEELLEVDLSPVEFMRRYGPLGSTVRVRVGMFRSESIASYQFRMLRAFYDDYPELTPRPLQRGACSTGIAPGTP
jgi:hypothetical protein